MEYAIESVALFNPSIVPALIQEGVPAGGIRFVMSLRAIGEGHLSSIVFRTGVIDAAGDIRLEAPPVSTKALKAILADHFHKSIFERDWRRLGLPKNNFDRSSSHCQPCSRARTAFTSDRGGSPESRDVGFSGGNRR